MKLFSSLKNTLITNTLLVAFLPLLAVGIFSLHFVERDIEKRVSKENMVLARTLRVETEGYLHHLSSHLESISTALQTRKFTDPTHLEKFLQTELDSFKFFQSIRLLDGQGRLRNSLVASDGSARHDDRGIAPETRALVDKVRQTGKQQWSDAHVPPGGGMPMVTLALPAGEWIVLGDFSLSGLNATIARLAEDHGYAYIVNREGRLIAHPDKKLMEQRYSVADLPIIKEGLAGNFGTYRYVFKGIERQGSIQPIPDTGWMIAAAQTIDEAYAPVREIKLTLLGGMLVAGALAFLSTFWSLGKLLRPLSVLGDNVQAVAGGDYSLVHQPSGFTELDELAGYVSVMGEAVNQREEELAMQYEELAMAEEELRQQMDEYHKSQDELCQTNFVLQTLIDASPIAIVAMDLEGIVTLWNLAAQQVFGWSAAEVVGHSIPFVTPETEAEYREMREELEKSGKIVCRDILRQKKDCSAVYLRHSSSLLYNAGGTPYGIMALYADITEHKAAEDAIRSMNAELEKRVAERTAQLELANHELESFSYSVSHDLRAPLRHIHGFSSALLEEYASSLDEKGLEYIHRVLAAIGRMDLLIDGLLKLSRVTQGAISRQKTSLSSLVRETMDELAKTQPERTVEFLVPDDDHHVDVDPQLFKVVVENLVGNAWKYTGKRDAAHIEFGSTTSNGVPTFYIRDNGAGFDMEYSDKLFGAFQRLHAVSEFEGTGIGLATVKRIVHRHGGRIWGEGRPGEGATFYFTVPGNC